jgi:uncharacterized repeat protein (TIGR01451 family)
MNPRKLAVGIAALLAFCLALPARAQIAGFGGTGTNWSLNNDPNSQSVPFITNDVLVLGTNKDAATSAFYVTPQYIGSFTASFTWQNASNTDQAGFVFAMQNDGTNAVGEVGGNYLGFVGMTLATGIAFNIDNGNGTVPGLGYAPTQVPGGGPGGYIATGTVNFHATNPIAVNITYASGVIGVMVTDTVTSATFSTNFIENLPATVAGSTAYVGFTGGGTEVLNVSISNFVFTPGAQPATLTNFPVLLSGGSNLDVTKLPGNESDGVIAYNPTNPAQLFIAANTNVEQGLFAATCSNMIVGTNITNVVITNLTAVSLANLPSGEYPAVAWDNYGNLFLAYADGSYSGIDVAVSTNGGKNFLLLTNLAKGHFAFEPRIAVGPGTNSAPGTNGIAGTNGSVWVLYKDYSLAYAPLVAQGAVVTNLGTNAIGAFGLGEIVPGSTNDCGFGDIAVGPQGQVMVAYQNLFDYPGAANCFVCVDANGLGAGAFGNPVMAAAHAIGGNTIIPASPDGQGINAAAGLAWDSNPASEQYGRVYLVCVGQGSENTNDTDIFLTSSTDSGATWSFQQRVNDDKGQNSKFLPRMAVDPTTGALALSWYDCRNDKGGPVTNITVKTNVITIIVTNDPSDNPPTNFSTNYSTNYTTNTTTSPSPTTNQLAMIYATVSLNGGVTFQPNVQVTTDSTNGYQGYLAGSPTDFGDYTGLAFYGGTFYPVWADNIGKSPNPNSPTNSLDVVTAPVTLTGLADVSITSVLVNPTNYNLLATNLLQIGSVMDYLLTASNNGPSAATAVYVTNVFPANVQVVFAFPTNTNNAVARGNYSLRGNTLIWPVGALPSGKVATILVETTASTIGNATNFAFITPGTNISDILTNNNTATLVSTIYGANLSLSITNSPSEIGYGAPEVVFTVAVTNPGPVAATGVLISNVLSTNLVMAGVARPAGVTYSTNFSQNSITFNIGSMATGQVVTVSITNYAPTNLAYAGPASATCSSTVLGVLVPATANISAEGIVPIVPPDIAIGMAASSSYLAVGDTITYTLYVTNLGPVPAFGVAVTNFLPPNLQFVSASVRKGAYTASPDPVTSGQTDIIAILDNTLQVGEVSEMVITATAASLGLATNVAEAGDLVVDLNPANNTAQLVTSVQYPDMAVGMTGSPSFIPVGGTVTYTLNVTNLGPVPAHSVLLTNALPTNLSFTTATVSGGTFATSPDPVVPGQTDIIFSLGTMAPNQTAAMTLTAASLSLGNATNVAVVASSQPDSDLINNTAQVITPVVVPNMVLGMIGSPSTITVGQQVVYLLTVTNLGPITATSVMVSNTLPTNLAFAAAFTTRGTYTHSQNQVVFQIGTLTNGQFAVATITATGLSLGSATNVAVVSDSQPVANLTNSIAQAVTTISAPDIALTMTGSPSTVCVGQTITYTLNVTNFGPTYATAVAVTNMLPAGLSFVGVSVPLGITYVTNQNGAVFNVGTMTNGQTAAMSILALAASAGEVTNTAIAGDSIEDTDVGNNIAAAVTIITNAPAPFFNITVVPGVTGVFITWNSPSNSTSQVFYGLTASGTNYTTNYSWLNPALTNYHIVLLTGLVPDTNYYFVPSSITPAVPPSNTTNGSVITFSPGVSAVTNTTNGTFPTTSTVILQTTDAYYAGTGWTPSGLANSIFSYNSSYVYDYVQGVGGSATASATFTPNIPVPGLYDVSVWYPANPGSFSSGTPMSATGATNQVSVTVNQAVNGGSWQPLTSGLFFATNGYTGNLTIFNNSGNTSTRVVANGARWVYELSQDAPTNGSVPAWWANFYFGQTVSGTNDTDADGYSNFAEYVLGTDPTSSSSSLLFTVTPSPSSNMTVSFAPFQGGRIYQLLSATNLLNPAWVTLTNAAAQNTNDGSGFFTVARTPGKPVFYRLAASLSTNQ